MLTYDLDHRRRPVVFLLQSDEKQEAYFEMFDATQEYFDQFHRTTN